MFTLVGLGFTAAPAASLTSQAPHCAGVLVLSPPHRMNGPPEKADPCSTARALAATSRWSQHAPSTAEKKVLIRYWASTRTPTAHTPGVLPTGPPTPATHWPSWSPWTPLGALAAGHGDE